MDFNETWHAGRWPEVINFWTITAHRRGPQGNKIFDRKFDRGWRCGRPAKFSAIPRQY